MSARDLPTRHPLAHRILVALGLVVMTAMLVSVGRFNAVQPAPAAVKLPTSLLFQLRDDDGIAAVSALVSPQGGEWLLLPADLRVGPDLTISTAAQGLDVRRAGQALADQTGVEVGDTWQLDRLGLAALIDSVGGVVVRVDEVLRLEAANGQFINLPKGERVKLDPNEGSRYALSGSPEEQAQRTSAVLQDLLRRLDGGELSALLPAVGSSSRSTLAAANLVAVIETLQQHNAAAPLRFTPLESELAFSPDGLSTILTREAFQRIRAAGVGFTSVP